MKTMHLFGFKGFGKCKDTFGQIFGWTSNVREIHAKMMQRNLNVLEHK